MVSPDISRSPSEIEQGSKDETNTALLTSPELPPNKPVLAAGASDAPIVSSLGLRILCLLAIQNCFKNLLMRYVMKDKPDFLTSAAVIGVEIVKLVLCVLYILICDKRSLWSIVEFMRDDYKHALLLTIPAAAYSFQMSMEYVALANLDAAIFSVLVQTKLLTTASFSAIILRKKFKYIQIISLVLLTAGVMLININGMKEGSEDDSNNSKGIFATLGIALSSGFASVYTEKVIKAQRTNTVARQNYSLAYMQVQLALVSLVILGIYALVMDYGKIVENGLLHNFTTGAFVSILNSAIGGLIVASVLKYADSVLKSYATAISVVLTGVLSMMLFGTDLDAIYGLGIVNVVCAVLLYNGRNMDKVVCGGGL
mmetsp:Transcript_13372/g.22139  ORF Transcript_13372/g.22139 Transcript_13372/m.22139 type:complete len:370 (+) Transcript_13372:80-1189(+)